MSIQENLSPSQSPELGHQHDDHGIQTNYHDHGSGRPLLLIHGSGPGVTAWANWRLTIPKLAQHARVIAPDMAGFGYTRTSTPETPDRALWLRQIISLLDALEQDQVSVIGNSFGGAIALALADQYPDRVRDIILMGSVGARFDLTEGLDKVWGYSPSNEAMRELLNVFVHDPSFITNDLIEMRYRASIRADVQERFAALFPAPRQRWIDALALGEDQISAIRQRTLLIHGREDQVIPCQVSERLALLLPNARLEIVERCGHWVQIEHPDIFVRLVSEFLGIE